MSNITALQAPGAGAVQPAKPTVLPVPDASKTSFSATDSVSSADSVKATDAARATDAAKQHVSVPGFQSPTTRIDPQNNAVILEYRDGQSGELLRQLPTKAQLRLYELNQEVKAHDAPPQVAGVAGTQGPGVPGQAGPAGADALGPSRTVSEA